MSNAMRLRMRSFALEECGCFFFGNAKLTLSKTLAQLLPWTIAVRQLMANANKGPKLVGVSFLAPDILDQTRLIVAFLSQRAENGRKVGDAKVGIYAFYDFDGAAIYVGQTREQVRVRVRRHLTNKRTDAVAMKVLDPMEVASIEVWPFWDLETRPADIPSREWDAQVRATLDAAEYTVYLTLQERFGNISDLLNEKIPATSAPIALPTSYSGSIVADESKARLYHADERIARRASTIAALAQIVKERDVSMGLRKTLVTQAERLQKLAKSRYDEIAGAATPEQVLYETTGAENEDEERDYGEPREGLT